MFSDIFYSFATLAVANAESRAGTTMVVTQGDATIVTTGREGRINVAVLLPEAGETRVGNSADSGLKVKAPGPVQELLLDTLRELAAGREAA